ncbi:hypothetical protein SAMN02949497_3246 [Methylomagnum ishizawai]|uniref:Uncharacterized protein n=1 Tax=Methylomagnum ishizawai TaxID=1760988 RepID=A0A1Y6D098_9GAMM|nr:hypothetical protein SAMN02949497_3246 [Methylomagnum ishizawai]
MAYKEKPRPTGTNGGSGAYSNSTRSHHTTDITYCLEDFRRFIRTEHGLVLVGHQADRGQS